MMWKLCALPTLRTAKTFFLPEIEVKVNDDTL